MWHLMKSIIPVVIGSLGLTGTIFDRFIERIPSGPYLKKIQKNVLTSVTHTLRRALSMKNACVLRPFYLFIFF